MNSGRRLVLASLFSSASSASYAAFMAIVAACGSRTGLLVPVEREASPLDAGPDVVDVFVPEEPDAAEEPDAVEEDAGEEDALPPIDVMPGPPVCPDAGSTLVYVIANPANNAPGPSVLLSFYPPTGTFKPIGTLVCPTVATDQPFSMAVDHTGIAYVEYGDGTQTTGLFRVSTLTAECSPTSFVPGQPNFTQFGMGFAANIGPDGGIVDDGGDAGDSVETLYLSGDPGGISMTPPTVLGSLDTTTFQPTTIGLVTPNIFAAELTGTGGGQLFGFYETTPGGTTAGIGQIDRVTGQLVAMSNLPGVDIADGWAFAFWGGDFYTFTAPGGSTIVQRFRPSDGSVVSVASLGLVVVGAGVSTCAPQM